MGKFNLKNLLFEEENTYEELPSLPINDYVYAEETPEVNIDINTNNTISIGDIYASAKVNDLAKSVYKVEEIKSVLPNTLPTVAKKESVLGMMKVSGITVDEVVIDADNRNKVLHSVLDKFTNDTVTLIEENSNEIKMLEDRINELKEGINSRKFEQGQQEKIIKDEYAKINSIIEFIG